MQGILDMAFNTTPEILDLLGRFESLSYLAAALLFILALAGLSNQKTAQRGNKFGIAGMAFALIATIILVVARDDHGAVLTLLLIAAAIAIGAVIGVNKARNVQMTAMPELVAMLHSFVGALLLVGSDNIVVVVLSFIAMAIAAINIFGGFLVTNRMLKMFERSSE